MMPRLAVALWIANVLTDTAGRVAFKLAAVNDGRETQRQRWERMLRSPALLAGIACFALEFVLWLALLSVIPLSQAMLMGSVNIVTVAVAGKLIFGETLSRTRVAGIALVAVGVAMAGGLA